MSGNGVVVAGQWELPTARTLEEFAAGIRRIAAFQKQYRWLLGRYLVEAEAAHGEKIWQYVDELGYSHQDVANMMSVYRRIGDQYTPEIKWSFWQALAKFEPEEREPLITRARNKTITREEIRMLASKSTNGNGNGAESGVDQPNPLIDALLLCGRLLSREAKGEMVDEMLAPALDELIAEAMQKLAKIAKRKDLEA